MQLLTKKYEEIKSVEYDKDANKIIVNYTDHVLEEGFGKETLNYIAELGKEKDADIIFNPSIREDKTSSDSDVYKVVNTINGKIWPAKDLLVFGTNYDRILPMDGPRQDIHFTITSGYENLNNHCPACDSPITDGDIEMSTVDLAGKHFCNDDCIKDYFKIVDKDSEELIGSKCDYCGEEINSEAFEVLTTPQHVFCNEACLSDYHEK